MEFIETTLSGIVIPTENATVDLAFTGGGSITVFPLWPRSCLAEYDVI